MKANLPEAEAAMISADLVRADLRGLGSHAVSRIPMYLERLRRGVVNPRPQIKITRVASAVALLDGDDGMGIIAGHRGMDEAIRLASECGIGMVGVLRSTHSIPDRGI